MRNIKTYEVGSTIKFTWISSGSSPTTIISSVLDGTETIVSSKTATSSGDGHYYSYHSVDTPGYYVNQWLAQVSANTYVGRQKFRAVRTEVD